MNGKWGCRKTSSARSYGLRARPTPTSDEQVPPLPHRPPTRDAPELLALRSRPRRRPRPRRRSRPRARCPRPRRGRPTHRLGLPGTRAGEKGLGRSPRASAYRAARHAARACARDSRQTARTARHPSGGGGQGTARGHRATRAWCIPSCRTRPPRPRPPHAAAAAAVPPRRFGVGMYEEQGLRSCVGSSCAVG